MSRAKSGAAVTVPASAPTNGDAATAVLRRHAEDQFSEELEALAKADTKPRPPRWRLSPWAVSTYLLGGTLDDGFTVSADSAPIFPVQRAALFPPLIFSGTASG